MRQEKNFPITAVHSEWIIDDEPMGSKNKFWIEIPGDRHPWLFKYTRTNDDRSTGEHWAEKVAAEIAGKLQLPHAEVELAEFNGCFGSLSRRFERLADDGVELVHGNDLLSGLLQNYDSQLVRGQQEHTLKNILNAIGNAIGRDDGAREEAFLNLGGYVLLDALILNTDRHHENWALLRQTLPAKETSHHIAPTFDHASSLGREHTDSKLRQWLTEEQWRVAWYAERGKGGIFLE
ncbi:HipA domain-containing protein [Salinisphaera sp. T5B8]|uniref:HipA domain-containing protein n=1 Tax=Salinisphaera sp. T5B8 TaxID=1304154 RepID=UPI00334041A0